MANIEMLIDSIRVSLMNYQRVVILKEKNGERYLPIWIGPNEADTIAVKLEGKHDFSLFAKELTRYKDCVRTVNSIEIKQRNSFVYIDINADGFLRCMARNIVSFLVQVGIGKITLKDAQAILKRKLPYHTNKPAPAAGLCLVKVFY